jgi:hypothetical protein
MARLGTGSNDQLKTKNVIDVAECSKYCSWRGVKGCEPSTRDGGLPFRVQELTVETRQALPNPLQPKLKLCLRQVLIDIHPSSITAKSSRNPRKYYSSAIALLVLHDIASHRTIDLPSLIHLLS